MTAAVSRTWATPLTLGVFTLMAGTGVLMFFHLDSGVQKAVHEWLGWAMLAAVGLHAAANWLGFKRYLTQGRTGRVVLAVSVLALAGSFVVGSGAGGGASPPVLAMRAVAQAPLTTVAALAGRPVAQLRADLIAAGIAVAADDQTIAGAVGEDREKMGLAMRTTFQPR